MPKTDDQGSKKDPYENPKATQPAADHSLPDILTVDEAARLLRISRWSLYDAVGRQEVPHRRLGKRIIFSRIALLAWVAEGGVTAPKKG